MATVVSQAPVLENIKYSLNYKGENTLSIDWMSRFSARVTNPLEVLEAQWAFLGNPLPSMGDTYDFARNPFLFAQSFQPQGDPSNLMFWTTTVNYGMPESGENPGFAGTDPVLRPPVFNIEYIENEYPIEQAEILVALPHGNGSGGERAINTVGPIVNAAGKRPDEPQVDTERNAVITIKRNFSTLDEIANLNEAYQRTTNEETVLTHFSPETLKYLVTDSEGVQTEGEYEFWPGTTRIEKKKTTQRVLDNMGYAYWDSTKSKIVDDDDIKDLHNLNLNGEKNSVTTTIAYRYLDKVPYTPLFS